MTPADLAERAHEALRQLGLARLPWSDLTSEERCRVASAAADVLARAGEWHEWVRRTIPRLVRPSSVLPAARELVFAEIVLEPESAREIVRLLAPFLPEPP